MAQNKIPSQADILQGNRRAIAKAITLLENTRPESFELGQELLESLLPHTGKALRLGITGVPGVGKSTFIDLLIGLLDPSEGQILIDGFDLKKIKKNWQKQIGYIPQESYLIDDTIKANIAFGVKENDLNNKRLIDCIKLAELEEFIKTLPDKENTLVGDRGTRLSGGQKQRIGIARSLYFNPKILIFDEPTSSLDTNTEDLVIDAINELKEEKTIILISHRINALKDCDKIFEVKNKKITEVKI